MRTGAASAASAVDVIMTMAYGDMAISDLWPRVAPQ